MEMFRQACPPGFMDRPHIVYDAEALFVEREALRRQVLGEPFSSADYLSELGKEIGLTKGARAIVAVSEQDARVFARYSDARIHIIGHHLALRPSATPFEDRKDILFVGALNGMRNFAPNVDALSYFIEEVMPFLDKKLGTGYRLLVAGRVESDDVRVLAADRVILLGLVEELEHLYGSCRIFIAPTPFAGGVAHKVHEAAAYGLPTVATGLIASQLNWKHDLDILVADSPVAFAECCATLYQDKVAWERIRTGALACVARDCAQDRFAASVGAMLADVAPRNRRGRSANPRPLNSDAKCKV